jgi:stringent starvation protein B
VTSSRPYLIRAIWQWINDNAMTPHLLVDAGRDGVEVPSQFVQDGRIVLNISGSAVSDLDLGNDWISFRARFSGVARDLLIPVNAVLGIYARENGQGMAFPETPDGDGPQGPEPGPDGEDGAADSAGSKRPSLKIVK